jgi:hypothetical protein
MAKLNLASSRRRTASCSRTRMAQISLSLKGAFWQRACLCTRANGRCLRFRLFPWLTPAVKEPASLRRVDRSLVDPKLTVANGRFRVSISEHPRSHLGQYEARPRLRDCAIGSGRVPLEYLPKFRATPCSRRMRHEQRRDRLTRVMRIRSW